MFAVMVFSLAMAGTPRVVGGQVSLPGAWPDTAAIVFDGRDVGCTGVLVAPDVVLTAGHCVGGITHVILDTVDYDVSGTWIPVTQTIEYPDSWGTYDLAVLLLETPSTIPPRVLATGCATDLYIRDGAPVTIVGYGAIDERGRRYTSELHEAYTIITDADCSNSPGCFRDVSPGGELGAGGGGIDSCYGDSGGPLYLNTPDGDFLVGLTSRSYNGVDLPCEEGGIYVRPDAAIEWIEAVSGRDLPDPVCSATPPENHAPVPTAEALVLDVNTTGQTRVLPNDVDPWQHHLYALATEPTLGDAFVGPNGYLVYEAGNAPGVESLDVTVTDTDGASATVSVSVTVVGPPPVDTDPPEVEDTGTVGLEKGGCGCDGTGGSAHLAWLGLLLLARRRSR